MALEKEDLSNTNLPIINLEDNIIYPYLGAGGEGVVYRYNKQIAFKIFYMFESRKKQAQKFQKVEKLAQVHDESFTFPIGLVGYEDGKKAGYYTNLVTFNSGLKDYSALINIKDKMKVIEYLIKADAAIQRIHQKGIILGDIKGQNIMINQDENPIFVDTDNYAYAGFDFDVIDYKTRWLYQCFHKSFSDIDNDIYIFAILALQILSVNPYFEYLQSGSYFKYLIDNMGVDNDVKDGLREIFSDAHNKPYIGPILKRIKPDRPIISKAAVHKLNRTLY